MNLVPKVKIEQISTKLEVIDQQIKHASQKINHSHIRFLIDDDAQVEGMLIHIDPDHVSDSLIYSVIGYCATHGMPYSITSWADFIND